MASTKKSQAFRTQSRHRKANRQPETRLQWLGAGAMTSKRNAPTSTASTVPSSKTDDNTEDSLGTVYL